jgi:hypothetical protein
MINALLDIQEVYVNNVIYLILEAMVFTRNHLILNAMNATSINKFLLYLFNFFFPPNL